MADDLDVETLERASLSLAVARWRLGHPDHAADLSVWVQAEHAGLDAGGIERAAKALAREAKTARASAPPESNPSLLAIRANLGSARSGFFGTAVGPLADFLRDQGEEVDELQIW